MLGPSSTLPEAVTPAPLAEFTVIAVFSCTLEVPALVAAEQGQELQGDLGVGLLGPVWTPVQFDIADSTSVGAAFPFPARMSPVQTIVTFW